jgi:hypothetical protein
MTETNWGEVFDKECESLVCPLEKDAGETGDEFNARVDAWWAEETLNVQRAVEARRDEASREQYAIELAAEKDRQHEAAQRYKSLQPRGIWGQLQN